MILLQKNLVSCLLQSDKPKNTEHILMLDKHFFYEFELYIYVFWYKKYFIYIYLCFMVYTVGTESIQTPLNFSLFVILQPFAKII